MVPTGRVTKSVAPPSFQADALGLLSSIPVDPALLIKAAGVFTTSASFQNHTSPVFRARLLCTEAGSPPNEHVNGTSW